MVRGWFALAAAFLAGCTSVGSVGVVTKTGADPMRFFKKSGYKELGPAEASACRFMALGVLPAGNADFSKAADRALEATGGDALVNVTTSNSLYSFVPIWNVFSVACTRVRGTAVKFNPE